VEKNYIMRSLMICTPHPTVWAKKSRRMIWARKEASMGERDHLGDPGVDGTIILRWIFRKWDVGVWNGWSWLRVGTGSRHL
jgi:hypothetical protein